MRIFSYLTKLHYHLLYISCSIITTWIILVSCLSQIILLIKESNQENLGERGRLLAVAVRAAIIVHVAVRRVIVRVHVAIRIGVGVQSRNVAVHIGRASPNLKTE